MSFDPRTPLVVGLVLVICRVMLGTDFTFATGSFVDIMRDMALLGAWLYALRSTVRLPFVAVIVTRRTRYAHKTYHLNWQESLQDGLIRGLSDRRRWRVGLLAIIDRATIIIGTMMAVLPDTHLLVMELCGFLGLMMLVVIYLFSGRFALLVGEAPEGMSPAASRFPTIT